MPEMTLGVVLCCSLFALSFSGTVMWLLEKKAAAARRQVPPLSYTFLAGSVTFSSVYILDRLLFPRWQLKTAVLNLALLAGMLLFPALKKKFRGHRQKAERKHPLYAETAALERMLEQDPLNAFCLERLSEIYEEMGKPDRALAAAHEAFKLDPTVKNRSRVEDLKKETHGQERRRGAWKHF